MAFVKGVWGVRNEKGDVSQKPWAGSKDTAASGRERYQRANFNAPAPFGTSQGDQSNQWNSTARQNYRGTPNDPSQGGAGNPTKQSQFMN